MTPDKDKKDVTPGTSAETTTAGDVDEQTLTAHFPSEAEVSNVTGSAVPEPTAVQPQTLPNAVRGDVTLLTDDDLFYFNEGTHFSLYNKLGSHLVNAPDGTPGTYFAVWAPNAEYVAVTGDFNFWDRGTHPLRPRGSSGIWEGFIPHLGNNQIYKYFIASRFGGFQAEKADPFAFSHETPPRTASVVRSMEYEWNDQEWMEKRHRNNAIDAPMSVYEMHLGSWMRMPEEGNRWLSYREMAHKLAQYLQQENFTHVEFMPIMEHPFYGSWGYQVTGFFAPTSRYGTPQDLMYLIDTLHQHGIGVILDWVPSHFPSDGHGLGYFDGTHLYEHFYPQKGWHPDWQSYIFNYGRHEVRAFLISSALFWLDQYHIDGLRVDAVASMLYLDYSRKAGEWMTNEYGGNENIEAIWFLRRFNEEVFKRFPDVQTIAEESTSWSMVSRPTYLGGLGFSLKWDMGWMHDTLSYMSREPIYRQYHHNELSFRMLYAFHENFCLPLSHDEVVHGKRSLIDKMPGDLWQKNANLRALFGYMFAQPAKKLIFMGGEIAQWSEWQHESSVDWHLLEWQDHRGMQKWISDLNNFYRNEPAMYEYDLDPAGFEWIDIHDWQNSTVVVLRKGRTTNAKVVIACNFTPVPRENYRVGVPWSGYWREALNSDAWEYAGSGMGNAGGVMAERIESHGREYSINITLPPLAAVFFVNPCEQG
jgi:1,4-alpha-glucan branching enzyme